MLDYISPFFVERKTSNKVNTMLFDKDYDDVFFFFVILTLLLSEILLLSLHVFVHNNSAVQVQVRVHRTDMAVVILTKKENKKYVGKQGQYKKLYVFFCSYFKYKRDS